MPHALSHPRARMMRARHDANTPAARGVGKLSCTTHSFREPRAVVVVQFSLLMPRAAEYRVPVFAQGASQPSAQKNSAPSRTRPGSAAQNCELGASSSTPACAWARQARPRRDSEGLLMTECVSYLQIEEPSYRAARRGRRRGWVGGETHCRGFPQQR